MKTKLLIKLAAAGVFLMAFVHPGHGGGHDVGTGRRAYTSDSYGFTVVYDKTLTFDEQSAEDIRFDDSDVVRSGEPISTLTYHVMSNEELDYQTIDSVEALARYASERHPNHRFEMHPYPGATAVESWTSESMLSYLLMGNHRVVRAELRNAKADNVLFKEIVSSFAYDFRAPDVSALSIQGKWNAEPGELVHMLMTVTDDASGVDWSSVRLDLRMNEETWAYARAKDAQPTANPNEWNVAFVLTPDTVAGEYALHSVSLQDYAGLFRDLAQYREHDVHYRRNRGTRDDSRISDWIETDIPVVRVLIENSSTPSPPSREDNQAPIVLKLVATSSWKSGGTAQLKMTATDEKSGIFEGSSFNPHFRRLNADGTISAERLELNGEMSAGEHADEWIIQGELQAYRTPGTYVLVDLTVSDHAGNERDLQIGGLFGPREGSRPPKVYPGTQLPVFYVRVENEGPVDATPPRVLRFALEDGDGRGRLPRFVFELEPGVAPPDLESFFSPDFTRLNEDGSETPLQNGDMTSEVQSTDHPNVYAVDLRFGPYGAPGLYRMDRFDVSDQAGNRLTLWAHENHYDPYRGHERSLPLLTAEIRNPR